jgi:hypothetical protein
VADGSGASSVQAAAPERDWRQAIFFAIFSALKIEATPNFPPGQLPVKLRRQ